MAKKSIHSNPTRPAPERAVRTRSASSSAPVASTSRSASSSDDRAKVLSERFHPAALDYLKKTFGLDLSSPSVPLSALYDIAAGRVTEPLEIVVTPMAYDKEQHKSVPMSPIKAVVSMRFILPYDRKTYKPVAPTKENSVFVATYPCYDYLQKSDNAEQVEAASAAVSQGELPKFGPSEVMALEGVGIREERLFSGSYNSLSVDEKRAILDGYPFDVNGTVRVADEVSGSYVSVNIAGQAKMMTDTNGVVTAKFDTRYPVEMKNDDVLDIMSVSRVGNIELDIFERDAHNKKKTDVNGMPIINQAGKDLIRYGQAFGPVYGYVHENTWNNETRKFENSIRKEAYQVSVVNGGLCVTPMSRVNDLDKDGNKVMVKDRNGKDVEKTHPEIKGSFITKDGSLRIGDQILKPVSERDLQNYRMGYGGAFLDYQVSDRKSGKKSSYTVYAVADNRRNGLAKTYSERVSKELIQRFAEVKKATRKQNFSLGF